MTKNERAIKIDIFSIISLSGDVLTLMTDEAQPPGYRIKLTLELPPPLPPVNITGKVISVSRAARKDSETTIAVKVHSLSRSDKERILEHIAKTHARPDPTQSNPKA